MSKAKKNRERAIEARLGTRASRGTEALRKTAIHEAGHVVAAWWLKVPIYWATIRPKGDCLGHVLHRNLLEGRDIECETTMRDRDRMERLVMVSLAGVEAVRQVLGRKAAKTDGCAEDFHKAVNLITYFAGSNEEVQAYFSWLEIRTKGLVSFHADLIGRTAVALMEKKELSRSGLKKIIEAQAADFIKTHMGTKEG